MTTEQIHALKEAFKAALREFHNEQDKGVLTPEQAAEILQVGTNKIYELCRRPGFPAAQVGKLWLINKEAMLDWIVKEGERQKAERRHHMHRMFLESKTS